MVKRFRKKVVEIEAIQYTGNNIREILKFIFPDIESEAVATELTIKTLEGDMKVSRNDWVIKGVKGEFYPCKPDIFDLLYETI